MSKFLEDARYNVVAVSDSKAAYYAQEGVKVEEVKKKKETKFICEGDECISNEELLELDVDVLIPAALENQITEKNASKINAKVILELANGPKPRKSWKRRASWSFPTSWRTREGLPALISSGSRTGKRKRGG